MSCSGLQEIVPLDDEWNVRASPSALESRNPIRELLESLNVPPSHGKEKISLAQGDPTVFGHLRAPQAAVDAMVTATESCMFNGYTHSAGSQECRMYEPFWTLFKASCSFGKSYPLTFKLYTNYLKLIIFHFLVCLNDAGQWQIIIHHPCHSSCQPMTYASQLAVLKQFSFALRHWLHQVLICCCQGLGFQSMRHFASTMVCNAGIMIWFRIKIGRLT